MNKSNKSIAGFHLLMILASVDGEVASAEGLLIQKYLAEEFPFRINLDNELEILSTLQEEEWKDHFEFHARCFYDDSIEKERVSFAKFSKTLIKADEEVTEREHTYYMLLKNIWKLN